MNSPLIADTENYDLCISKFKIGTECVPIFIQEMEQPVNEEDYADIEGGITNTPFLYSTYKIAVMNPYDKIGIVRVKIYRNRKATQTAYEKKPYFRLFKKSDKIYVDGTDKSLFMYDYQTFIDCINITLQSTIS